MNNILDNLNERQKEAVVTTEGAVMVIAGAGSGKTRVLTRRIAYLINELGVYPSNILAVTFTNKAAKEMKERVASLVNYDTRFMWISTFHSFCARFLRQEVKYLNGYTTNFSILDTDDCLKIIKQLTKDDSFFDDVKASDLLNMISVYKNNPEIYFSERKQQYFDIIYPKYQEQLLIYNSLDFDDLILKTLEILKNNEEIRTYYQEKFQYILVDEYQDTNNVQFELINILGDFFKNVFIVGDQDQSIYSFRGAEVKNIEKFRKHYKNPKIILLEENYRSTKQILSCANRLISKNKERIEKNLYSTSLDGSAVIYNNCNNATEEAYYVYDKIKEFLDKGYTYADIAIMYRNNFLSRNFEDLFVSKHIPYVIYGGLSFYSRAEIKDMIAYIRLVIDHSSNLAFKRIINIPKRGIGVTTIDKLEDYARENNLSMMDAIDTFDSRSKSKLIEFKNLIYKLESLIEDGNLVDFVNNIYEISKYKEHLEKNEEEDRIENIKEFLAFFNEVENDFDDITNYEKLVIILNDLALRTDSDNDKLDLNKIKLMTIHQAKGLEFKICFIVGLEQGLFPRDFKLENDLEEERRICYVAVTRAKEHLILTSASERFVYGHTNYSTVSTFVRDMGLYKTASYIDLDDAKEVKAKKEAIVTCLNPGDKVEHKIYGVGLVLSCNEKIVEIAFKVPYGIRKLQKNHPSIKKI